MKGKRLRTLLGLCFIFLLAFLFFLNPTSWTHAVEMIENQMYDMQVRYFLRKIPKEAPLLIVDIDDKSLRAVGRWPWSREAVAKLTDKLFENEVAVVVFDLVFSEPQKNLVDEILPHVEGEQASALLEKMKPLFDFDALFAKSLQKGDSILGFILKREGESSGVLPPPLLTLSPPLAKDLFIPNLEKYLGNIAVLQKAAKKEAFLNATPDPDGVCRKAAMILRHEEALFPSLSLEAIRSYLLLTSPFRLITADYSGKPVLEGIAFNNWEISTDALGQIFIPFYGPPYSFPLVSASDVLEGQVPKETLQGKLVLIGSTATAVGDLQATPISPNFPGVEIHANLAMGLFEHSLPHKPAWSRGVSVFLLFLLGFFGALLFPRLGPFAATLLFAGISISLFGANLWIWKKENLILSLSLPFFSWSALYAMNLILGYFFEKVLSKKIKGIFSQYLPKERIELLIQKKEREISLEGESKELTVLFADIRNFTHLCEGKSASETKHFLNLFLTPMTEAIFRCKGTVDKYVGDLIMAFWGAPLEDPTHPLDAAAAAWQMQEKLLELNQGPFRQSGWPEIRLGIALNTGTMNVGDMGSKFRRAYTVLGDAVNFASRLEGLTKYYGVKILLGPKTFAAIKDTFVCRHLDKVRVLGKNESRDIYELFCPKGSEKGDALQKIALYEEALQNYFAKKWEAAEALFQKLLSSDPTSEVLYRLYLTRIAFFKKTPPPKEWDGAFSFEQK